MRCDVARVGTATGARKPHTPGQSGAVEPRDLRVPHAAPPRLRDRDLVAPQRRSGNRTGAAPNG